ncbi:Uncharacterised protein [Bordetella pertussis]|nr:Uncharacterised protein [Bordetella pertussis]
MVRRQPGDGRARQPGAHVGQRLGVDAAQTLQQQRLGRAEEGRHLGRRLGGPAGQHARAQRHAQAGELLVQAGRALHHAPVFARRRHHRRAARVATDQPFGHQGAQGLPHHAARHAEAVAQRRFAGQHGTGGQPVIADMVADCVRHLRMQGRCAGTVQRKGFNGGQRHAISLQSWSAQFPILDANPAPAAPRARRPAPGCPRAMPLPAMSNAVPWSTDTRTTGRPP